MEAIKKDTQSSTETEKPAESEAPKVETEAPKPEETPAPAEPEKPAEQPYAKLKNKKGKSKTTHSRAFITLRF